MASPALPGFSTALPARLRCLLIEANPIVALDVHDLLATELGGSVDIETHDATGVVAAIEAFRPDLVITDLSALRRAKMTPQDMAIRTRSVIVLTGDLDAGDWCRGPARCLQKPFRNGELVALVREALADLQPQSPPASIHNAPVAWAQSSPVAVPATDAQPDARQQDA